MLAELDPLVTQRRYSPENKKQRESSQRFAGWWVCGASTYWYQSPELSIIPRFLQPLWSWRSGKEPVGLSFPPQRNKKPLKQCRRRGEMMSLNFGKLALPAACRGDFNRTWMPVRRFWDREGSVVWWMMTDGSSQMCSSSVAFLVGSFGAGLLTTFSLEQKRNPPAHHLLPLGNPAGRRDLTFDICSHLQQRLNSRGNAWTCTFIL